MPADIRPKAQFKLVAFGTPMVSVGQREVEPLFDDFAARPSGITEAFDELPPPATLSTGRAPSARLRFARYWPFTSFQGDQTIHCCEGITEII